MRIKKVKIENFRGLDIEVDDLKKRFLIIGKNDSGKSNFCYAIRKVLDYNVRKLPFIESDSSDSNLEDISIRITLSLDQISSNNRANLKQWIDTNDDGTESITVELIAHYNSDIQAYDEEIVFGTIDKSSPKSAANGNDLDKVLDLIYVYPNYDLNRDTNNYFSYHKQKNHKDGVSIGSDVIDGIKELNSKISSDKVVNQMQEEINDLDSMREMFDEISFKIKSDFDISNVYKSLKIFPFLPDGKSINIGDGKSKTLALLLQKSIKKEDKEKIIILEEPENHLFPLLQKQYASIIDNFNFNQTIITTHSPSIIDFRKTDEILRFSYKNEIDKKKFRYYRVNVFPDSFYKTFGYALNEEIAEIFFYNEVLLIEGYSEKIFYNRLVNTDENFRKNAIERGFGVVSIYGVDFAPSKSMLEALGIRVHVLTDNDFFKVQNQDNKMRFAGLQRALKLLNEHEMNELKQVIGDISNNDLSVVIDSNEYNKIIEKMDLILVTLRKFKIYIHDFNNNGFESAFADFIGKTGEDKKALIDELTDKKMKGLHAYLVDKAIDLRVNDANKNNILVRLFYEN
jgi:putative ATP-dependent endonuclease of OLD family